MKSAKTLMDIKEINKNKILQRIYFHGPLSRLEICEETGLSPATVGNLMTQLLNDNVVLETGFEQSQGGRRRVILETNSEIGNIIGIDIGRTYIQVELFNFHMEVIASRKHILDNGFNSDSILEILGNVIDGVLKDVSKNNDSILGIGIALPGLVNIELDEIQWVADARYVASGLKKGLEHKYNTKVLFDNGSKAMALAEYWFGAGKGCRNIISTIIGRGVGSGLIVDGKLVRGEQNYSGEWGHTFVSITDSNGKSVHKTIEQLINEVFDNFWKVKGNGDSISNIDPKAEINAVKALAEAGDKVALQSIDDLADILGLGLCNFVNLFNPEVIILGGWLSVMLSSELEPRITSYLQKYSKVFSTSEVLIKSSHFGDGESCIGAASLVINSYLGFNI